LQDLDTRSTWTLRFPDYSVGELEVITGPDGESDKAEQQGAIEVSRSATLGLKLNAEGTRDHSFLDDLVLTGLCSLYVGWSELDDAALCRIARLVNLEDLFLLRTAINDAGLAHLVGLASLRSLVLWNTTNTDAGLAHLAGLVRLGLLDLRKTAITAAGLAHLARKQ
jgi:hypothetical protein